MGKASFRTRAAQLAFVACAAASTSCLTVDFEPASVIDSVRILATRADKPYAKPGDTVSLEMLAVDGRPNRAKPMELYWIPLPCINPQRDLYYLCFAQFATQQASGGSGSAGAAGLQIRPGLDITDFLPKGPTFQATLPQDVITSHPPTPGAAAPYGLSIIFNMACAGRVKVESPTDNPQNIPLGCYDDQGRRLDANDFVVGFTRLYAYDSRTNGNPEIEQITFEGKPVGDEGITVDHCTKEKFRDCDTKKIGLRVPDAAWEVNDLSTDKDGKPQHESIWATYYGTIGRFGSEVRLLFDANSGRVGDSDNELRIPREIGTGKLWIVVRDNRGGASWREITLNVR